MTETPPDDGAEVAQYERLYEQLTEAQRRKWRLSRFTGE